MSTAAAMSLSIIERWPLLMARRMPMPISSDCTPCCPCVSLLILAPCLRHADRRRHRPNHKQVGADGHFSQFEPPPLIAHGESPCFSAVGRVKTGHGLILAPPRR